MHILINFVEYCLCVSVRKDVSDYKVLRYCLEILVLDLQNFDFPVVYIKNNGYLRGCMYILLHMLQKQ